MRPVTRLFTDEHGTLEADALGVLREILALVRAHLVQRELNTYGSPEALAVAKHGDLQAFMSALGKLESLASAGAAATFVAVASASSQSDADRRDQRDSASFIALSTRTWRASVSLTRTLVTPSASRMCSNSDADAGSFLP